MHRLWPWQQGVGQHPRLTVDDKRVVELALIEVGDATQEVADGSIDADDALQLRQMIHGQAAGHEDTWRRSDYDGTRAGSQI